ncbi:HEXXH motif-containing putative peptide modification protein [Actinosynnema sp. NPDC051121]
MTTVHRMSRAMFRELASGRGGIGAVHALAAARRSRVLAALRALVDLAVQTGHSDAPLVRTALRGLADVPWTQVREVLAYPRVAAWVLRTAGTLAAGRPEEAAPRHLLAVLAAARSRAGIPGTVELPAAATVVLPTLGTYTAASIGPVRVTTSVNRTTLFVGSAETPITNQVLPGWSPVERLAVAHRGLRLDLKVDGAPSSGLPDEVVVRERFADDLDAATWRKRLADGWGVLVDRHRRVAEEVAAAATVLMPLASPTPEQVSATFADMFGCVAMSLPADDVLAALTLAHEVQHAKLSALADLFTLVRRDSSVRLYAPWRSDPRPPAALLQGTYAHLGVAAFWRKHTGWQAEVEFARWRSAAQEAARSLVACGALTDVGAEFVGGMKEVLDAWSVEPVSRRAEEEAKRLNEEHRSLWLRAHG